MEVRHIVSHRFHLGIADGLNGFGEVFSIGGLLMRPEVKEIATTVRIRCPTNLHRNSAISRPQVDFVCNYIPDCLILHTQRYSLDSSLIILPQEAGISSVTQNLFLE